MKTEGLRANLEVTFKLPPAAVDWLMSLFHATQVFDDYADGDPVERRDLNQAIWETLASMPTNPFYIQNAFTLGPAVGLMVLKWQGSDRAEREHKASAKSYMWRAGYYDVVLAAIQCAHGPEVATELAHHVMELYGETWEDYREEFNA